MKLLSPTHPMRNAGKRLTEAAVCFGMLISVLSVKSYAQADIHFSQFYETSILRNPALTGVFADDYKVGAYYRSQWSSISNPFSTAVVSAESRVSLSSYSEDFFSFGMLGYVDEAGSVDQKITSFYPAVNYNKCLNPDHNTYLSVGFTGGYVQYSFDPSKATFNNQYQNGSYSPTNPSMENLPTPRMTMWDLGTGINLNSSRGEYNNVTYMLGISGYHFTQPKFSYFNVPGITENIRWNANGAISYNLNEDLVFQGQANFAMQGTYQEIMVGGLLSWTQATDGPRKLFTLTGGVFYRYGDAILPVLKAKYKGMAMAVSYDVNVSSLKEASDLQGGYEVTLFFSGNYSSKNSAVKKVVCPKF